MGRSQHKANICTILINIVMLQMILFFSPSLQQDSDEDSRIYVQKGNQDLGQRQMQSLSPNLKWMIDHPYNDISNSLTKVYHIDDEKNFVYFASIGYRPHWISKRYIADNGAVLLFEESQFSIFEADESKILIINTLELSKY